MDNIDIPKPNLWHESFLKPITATAAAKLFALFVLVAVPLYAFFGKRRQRLIDGVPIVGMDKPGANIKELRERFRTDAKEMVLEGYRKHKGKLFYVPSPIGERLMLPPKYMEEFKNFPAHQADFPQTFIEMFDGQHTTIGTEQTLHPHVIRSTMNKQLPFLLEPVDQEVQSALADLTPPCDDWIELDYAAILVRVIARAASRMMGGEILSQHEGWTDSMINFTGDCFVAAQKLKTFPESIRYIARYFLPEVKKIWRHFDLAHSLVAPICKERTDEGKKQNDLVQWMVDAKEHRSDNNLAEINLHVAFAAVHTSAVAISNIINNLCAMPEYVEPLTEEITRVLAEEGGFNMKAIQKMTKVDSFFRETQRLTPLLMMTGERWVHKDLKLPDGLVVPANTQVGIPAHAIGWDEDFYPEPMKFKGFRFHDLRDVKNPACGPIQYTAANSKQMSWGFGNHLCPGRRFADAEFKIILARLLLNYEFKFPPGKGRPKLLEFETQNIPEPGATIMLKRRVPLEEKSAEA